MNPSLLLGFRCIYDRGYCWSLPAHTLPLRVPFPRNQPIVIAGFFLSLRVHFRKSLFPIRIWGNLFELLFPYCAVLCVSPTGWINIYILLESLLFHEIPRRGVNLPWRCAQRGERWEAHGRRQWRAEKQTTAGEMKGKEKNFTHWVGQLFSIGADWKNKGAHIIRSAVV